MSQNQQFEVADNQVTVHVAGELQGAAAAILREKLLQYIENGYWNFIVNLAEVKAINSTGLGVLVNVQKHVSQNDGAIMIAGLQGAVKTAFMRTRLNKAFDICEEPNA